MDNAAHALDRFVVRVLVDHVGDVDDLKVAFAILLLNVVDEELRFAGIPRCAANVVASCDELLDYVVANVAGRTRHEDGIAFLDGSHGWK